VSQVSRINTDYGYLDAAPDHAMWVVRLRIENTTDKLSTLELNLEELSIVDAMGENHLSRGLGFGERPMDHFDVMYSWMAGMGVTGSSSAMLPDGRSLAFELATDGESGTLTIGMPDQSATLIAFAFQVPVDATDLQLFWPGLPPVNLAEASLP
jgi:hypothetical protein